LPLLGADRGDPHRQGLGPVHGVTIAPQAARSPGSPVASPRPRPAGTWPTHFSTSRWSARFRPRRRPIVRRSRRKPH